MAGMTELESWVRDELSMPAEGSVAIREVPGNDPRCSPVVTEVTVDNPTEEPFSFHIEHPLAEVTHMDLIAALAFGGGH